jgi:hypothetical protein
MREREGTDRERVSRRRMQIIVTRSAEEKRTATRCIIVTTEKQVRDNRRKRLLYGFCVRNTRRSRTGSIHTGVRCCGTYIYIIIIL